MSDSKLQITRRRLPHWALAGGVYFVTFRVAKGLLTEEERSTVLSHIRAGDAKFYELGAVVIMPDHVHAILKPLPDISLSQIMKGIKGASARQLNKARNSVGHVWQDESWDRIVRDDKELEEKLQYMLDNPVKAGLVKTIEQYGAWYLNPEFR